VEEANKKIKIKNNGNTLFFPYFNSSYYLKIALIFVEESDSSYSTMPPHFLMEGK